MNHYYLLFGVLYVFLFNINHSLGENIPQSGKSDQETGIKDDHHVSEITKESLNNSDKGTHSSNDNKLDAQSHGSSNSKVNKTDITGSKTTLNENPSKTPAKKGSKKRSVDNPYAFNIEDILRMGNNRRTKRMKRNPNFDGAIPLIGLISNNQDNNFNTPEISDSAFTSDLAEDNSVYAPLMGDNDEEYERDSPHSNFLLESSPYQIFKSNEFNGYPFRNKEPVDERPEPLSVSNFYPYRRIRKSYYALPNIRMTPGYLKYDKNPKVKALHARYPWTNDEDEDDIQKKIRILAYLFKEQLPLHQNRHPYSESE